MNVELNELRSALRYINGINAAPLRAIHWTDDGRPVFVSDQEIDDWKFTGLNNKDFAEMHLLPPHISSTTDAAPSPSPGGEGRGEGGPTQINP